MAKIPVQQSDPAPFGGITRIRFKGSVAGATLSAIAAPPHYCFRQNRTRICEVNGTDNAFHLIAIMTRIYPAGDVGGGVTFESV